jgi:hypothetical protein
MTGRGGGRNDNNAPPKKKTTKKTTGFGFLQQSGEKFVGLTLFMIRGRARFQCGLLNCLAMEEATGRRICYLFFCFFACIIKKSLYICRRH